MRYVITAYLAAAAYALPASAADTIAFGPVPAWVQAVRPSSVALEHDDEPARVLLSDQQVALERGRRTTYADIVISIQTPPGLAAGNIAFAWRPDTDVPIVHKLLIRRGEQTIDVLASGQKFAIARRERNLESATLDGVLTASIQPEGLQVGDVLEFAVSVTSSDPVLQGHVETVAGAWSRSSVGRAHLRVQWPSTLTLNVRQTSALPVLKPVASNGTTSIEMSLDDVEPFEAPRGAPPRYSVGRVVDVTDFASWADVGALFAPLYEKAAAIAAQGELRQELERIRSLSPEPKMRAEAALALVQDKIRYFAMAMGAGGLVPADAETTWARRFGDCKGKTTLLLALLHGLSIQAEPVAVNAISGDGLDSRLPMIGLFNHVVVRATLAGRTYWLDGTRTGDTDFDRLTVPNFGWGLPLISTGAALVRMLPAPLDVPSRNVSIRIDARGGLTAPAPFSVDTTMRGDEAAAMNRSLTVLTGKARDRALRDRWKRDYDFVTVSATSAVFDPRSGEEHLAMQGVAQMDWNNGAYETNGTSVGYRADFAREPGPDRDAPFSVSYPDYNVTRETILLPEGFHGFKVGTGMDVDQIAGGVHYLRHAAVSGSVFTIEKSERSLMPEFPAKEAPAAQVALRALAGRSATLQEPLDYKATDAEISAARKDGATTVNDYLAQARAFRSNGLIKEAYASLDKAIALDPGDVSGWADRGMMRLDFGDLAGSRSDLAKAESLDPNFIQTIVGRGMLADAEKRPRDAIAAYSKAISLDPTNHFAIGRRALDYAATGQNDQALADATAAIKLDTTWVDLYSLRARIFVGRGEIDRAGAEMRAAIAVDPKRAFSHVAAARIQAFAGRGSEALAEYDRALALDSQASTYAEKSRARSPGDHTGRQADIDAALKLDSKSVSALDAQAALQLDEGDSAAAIAGWTHLLDASPGNANLLAERAEAYRQSGDDDRELADTEAALRQKPKLANLYLMRANVFVRKGKEAEALSEAAAVEAADPDEAYAHVVAANIFSTFHKAGEARQAYDRAISIRPEAYIYLNRSLNRPKADATGRLADLVAALKLQPGYAEALVAKGELQVETGDFAGGIATETAALGRSPADPALLVARGVAYARSGDQPSADADFARAGAIPADPAMLNRMCWAKATAGVALEQALADCNAALAKAPDAASYLDSRALVLLRIGRTDDAIADYGRALAKRPHIATSLYGRGVAWARKGDQAQSQADLALALKADPEVADDFVRYGVTP